MRLYTELDQMEPEKKIYGQIAFMSKVRVEYEYKNEKYLLVPYFFGDLVVLVEIKDEKEIVELLLEKYIKDKLLEGFIYDDDIKNLAVHFKTELKKFRILVVKYNKIEEKEFSRYSLSNITFGVVSHNNLDIHLIPSSADVKSKEGYCISGVVDNPEEGLRQAFLLLKWFGKGKYEELPNLALESELEESKIALLYNWEELLKYVLFSEIDDKYYPLIISKLNQFRNETYFNPSKNIEKIALGILLSKMSKLSRSSKPLQNLEYSKNFFTDSIE
ncbi:MAG: DUF4940 domain-containing protein [Fervidobacterium sp.]